MAPPRFRKPCSPALVTQTRQAWQGFYDAPLTDEDAGIITRNMVEFFAILMEWDRTLHTSETG